MKVKTFLFIFFYLYYKHHPLCLVWTCCGDITFIQGRVGGRLKDQKKIMKREKTEGRKLLEIFCPFLSSTHYITPCFSEHLSSSFLPQPLNSQALAEKPQRLSTILLGNMLALTMKQHPCFLKTSSSLSLLFHLRKSNRSWPWC